MATRVYAMLSAEIVHQAERCIGLAIRQAQGRRDDRQEGAVDQHGRSDWARRHRRAGAARSGPAPPLQADQGRASVIGWIGDSGLSEASQGLLSAPLNPQSRCVPGGRRQTRRGCQGS